MKLKIFRFEPVDRQGDWLEKLNSEICGAAQVEFFLLEAGSCSAKGEKILVVYILTPYTSGPEEES